MTRINVVEPSELSNKHLMGEIHEITRVYGLVRKAQERKINRYNFKDKIKQPCEYTLGTGHVYFFYDKLRFITERYYALNKEAVLRNFKVNPIQEDSLVSGIQAWWFNSYDVTSEASMKHIQNYRIVTELDGILDESNWEEFYENDVKYWLTP